MIRTLTTCLYCLLACMGSAQAIQLHDTAALYGKGVISTGDFTSNISFTPDGNTAFYCVATINWGYIAIFETEKKSGAWQKPKAVSFTGVYRDTDPFVTADGKRLYFSSDRPVNGQPYKEYDYHLYYVSLDGNKITSQPVLWDGVNQLAVKLSRPSFASNGNIYFFNRDTAGEADIYMCTNSNGTYGQPVRLGFNDKKFYDFDPIIAKDESFIIFTSNNRKGEGSNDLFISFNNDGTWGEPVNMGTAINTKGNDAAPCLSQDDKTLYFTSYRETSPRPVYKNTPGYKDIMQVMHSTTNGMRHIYVINIENIKQH